MRSEKDVLEMLQQMQNDMGKMRDVMEQMHDYVKGLQGSATPSEESSLSEGKLAFIEDSIKNLKETQAHLEGKLSEACHTAVTESDVEFYDSNEDISWMFMVCK